MRPCIAKANNKQDDAPLAEIVPLQVTATIANSRQHAELDVLL